ncbi:MAG TPA: polysaccharide deacetylase family protein [Polyangiaceae bacterium]
MIVRLCSVSIDLDEIACYLQIHGLAPEQSHAVYDIALGRIRSFASDLGVSLTLFVIARDLDRLENVTALRPLVADGHEIGNHSLDHLYDLTRRGQAEQERQIDGANQRLKSELGVTPSGFRAPGYTVTDGLLTVVAACGLHYDSSVFPCPPYFAAKAARLVRMKIAGQNSRAVLDTPRVLRAPTVPYRVGEPYWSAGSGLLELPIQVAGPLRMPFIGTALSLLGPSAARLLTLSLIGKPMVNLELHGIDFLDARDVPAPIQKVQPDVRVPVARKLETFSAVIALLRKHAYAVLRLDEAARAFA